MIDLDNPTIASLESVQKFKPEDLKAVGSKDGKTWVFTAYVEDDNKIIIVAISHGKNPKKVMREVMTNAINRLENKND